MTLEIFSHITKENNPCLSNEVIKTEINQLAIIPILSDSIYKDPISAIRELYANEVTACKKSTLKTRIEIKLNSNTKELSIQGFNSMGITRETFDKILKVMGNSGNNNGKYTGLFGLGFFSHVKLSEKMICHTFSQENNERFSFISNSGLSFEILPDEFSEKLNEYGMKVTLTVKDNIDLDLLINKIKDIIEFSVIESIFILDDVQIDIHQYKSLKEKMKIDCNLVENIRYSETSYKIYQNSNEFYDIIIYKKYPNIYHHSEKCYLLNVPIEFKIQSILKKSDYYNDLNIYLNVKNELLFLPHVSRDYFTIEAENKLIELIKNDITIFDQSYEIINENKFNLMNFINDPDRLFKYDHPYFYVKSIHEKRSRLICDSIVNDFKFCDFEIKGICIIENFNVKIMQQLFDLKYLCYASSSSSNDSSFIVFNGLSDANTILKENNIKSKIGIKLKKSFVYKKNKEQKYIFKVRDPKFRSECYHDIGFVNMDSTEYEDPLIEIPKILKNTKFWTSQGMIKFNELKGMSIYYTDIIYPKLQNKFAVYITDKLIKDLVSIYFNFKEIQDQNMFQIYALEYKFKNETLLNLLDRNIINLRKIQTKKDLDYVLGLDI